MVDTPAVRVDEKEHLVRCVLFPKNVSDSQNLAAETLFDVSSLGSGARTNYASSVAAESMVPTEEEAHLYGCRTAANANRRLAQKPRFIDGNFDRRKDGYRYLGFYRLKTEDVLALQSEIYTLDVVFEEEEGEKAHCNLLLICKNLPEKYPNFKAISRAARTSIIARLYRKLAGPRRHVCSIDLEDSEELGRIHLEELPPVAL